ncbi:hypothetical protein F6Y05_35330 [Bacillus megaterium]|nr:hypothetical protein [Priestia megaterium]
MSLKRVIKTDQDFKRLFNKIPDVTNLIKCEDNKSFFESRKIVAPPITGSNPQDVGTAYDFWLRAHIQRINNISVENNIPDVIYYGVRLMESSNVYTDKHIEVIKNGAAKAWEIRNDYILGKDIEDGRFAKALLFLAYIEDFYRSGSREMNRKSQDRTIKSFIEINKDSVQDLINLMNLKDELNNHFKAQDVSNLFLNPTFGETARYINGADGDLIIDDFLIDFKTDKRISLGVNNQYLYQIVGYYILSTENRLVGNHIIECEEDDPYDVNRIGFYFARYGCLSYIEIEDLKKAMEDSGYPLRQFINDFKDLAEDKYNGVI